MTEGMVIYKTVLADSEDGHGGDGVVHNSEGRSKANPPALTPSHRVGYNYLTDREVQRGKMALELQQSGRGTTGGWLNGARRDAEVE